MKTNKTYLLAVRISEDERKMLKRIAKQKKKTIPVLIREFISLEDLKLLNDEQSQERMFDMSDVERQSQIQRAVMSLATLTINTGKNFNVVDLTHKRKEKSKEKSKEKRKEGIRQNE